MEINPVTAIIIQVIGVIVLVIDLIAFAFIIISVLHALRQQENNNSACNIQNNNYEKRQEPGAKNSQQSDTDKPNDHDGGRTGGR